MLNLSFEPVPMISSLISGLPSRWIWRKGPLLIAVAGERLTVIFGREVEP